MGAASLTWGVESGKVRVRTPFRLQYHWRSGRNMNGAYRVAAVGSGMFLCAILAAQALAGAIDLVPAEYQPNYQSGYNSGYSIGYESGYSSGNTRGKQEGTTHGRSDGYASGWQATYQPAYDSAYGESYPVGQQEGWKQGVLTGMDRGFAWADEQIRRSYVSGSTISLISNTGSYGSIDMSSGVVIRCGNAGLDIDAADYYLWRNSETDWKAEYYRVGYEDGNAKGKTVGDAAGYAASYPLAYAAAFDVGVGQGKVEGQRQGAVDGQDEGFSDGYFVTYDDGYGQGFTAGVQHRLTGKLVLPQLNLASSSSSTLAAVPEPAILSILLTAIPFSVCRRRVQV